jgi:hypothetical protein
VKSSNTNEKKIVSYSTTLDFPSKQAGCSNTTGNAGWSCKLSVEAAQLEENPRKACRHWLGFQLWWTCYATVKVTEEIISPVDFKKRYW